MSGATRNLLVDRNNCSGDPKNLDLDDHQIYKGVSQMKWYSYSLFKQYNGLWASKDIKMVNLAVYAPLKVPLHSPCIVCNQFES